MSRSLRIVLLASLALAAVLALLVNYASVDRPKWFEDDPTRIWLVLGLVLLATFVVTLLGAPNPDPTPGPTFGTGDHSFRPPTLDVLIRGRGRERWRLNLGARGLVVLAGAGGMGKTTLANAAANAALGRGRKVYWIRFGDEEELAGRMLEVAKELGLKQDRIARAQGTGASLPDLVWRHLDRTLGWMIVLDNIDRAAAASPSAIPWLSTAAGSDPHAGDCCW